MGTSEASSRIPPPVWQLPYSDSSNCSPLCAAAMPSYKEPYAHMHCELCDLGAWLDLTSFSVYRTCQDESSQELGFRRLTLPKKENVT